LQEGLYVRVPLLPQSTALQEVQVDGKQGLVVSADGYHHVVLSESGTYIVNVTFSLKSSLHEGPHKLDLAIQPTPITLFNLELPLHDIEVEIPNANQVATNLKGNATLISAALPPGRAISVRWRKQLPVSDKIPARLYSDVYHLIAIDDDRLTINSDINLNVLHSELDAIRLAIPAGVNVLQVSGEGVGDWHEIVQQDRRLLQVPFTYGKKGGFAVRVTTETPQSETGLNNIFTGIKVEDSVRETGFIAVELNTSAEVVVTENGGLEKIPVQNLPGALFNQSAKPLIMGFKYLKHPYRLALDVKKHQKVAVPVATINTASVVTLFTEDGKTVHRVVYQISNRAKQFLEIQLPEDAAVWSIFVAKQPAEASMNRAGRLLVPLVRSRADKDQLQAFEVEVVYALAGSRFSWTGGLTSSLPVVDLMTSQLIWSVYLPNDYAYLYFDSTLEKEELIRGLNVFSGAYRRYNEADMRDALTATDLDEANTDGLKKAYRGDDYKSSFRNVPVAPEQITGQVHAELEFGGRLEGHAGEEAPQSVVTGGATGTGVLPIQIKIPTGGQVYRFARTVIEPEDPLTFTVVYSQSWLITLFRYMILVCFVVLLWLVRNRLSALWSWLAARWHHVVALFQMHHSSITKHLQSTMIPIVCLGLVVIFWPLSRSLTTLFLFCLWVSSAYQFLQYYRRKIQTKSLAIPEEEA
jgi:hypothetical protein